MREIIHIWPDTVMDQIVVGPTILFMRQCGDNSIQLQDILLLIVE